MSKDSEFERKGFRHFPQALDNSELDRLRTHFDNHSRAGARLGAAALKPIADLLGRSGSVGKVASAICQRPPFVVRAILFDKQPDINWSLGWHQDRTINVAERVEIAGYGPWTVKQGLLHVQPPQALIDEMVTLRVHLDDVPNDNGPLSVIPESHRLGRLSEDDVAALAAKRPAFHCIATSGDVWAYSTAIVHASSSVADHRRGRRVLQLDYACSDLERPLRWAMAI